MKLFSSTTAARFVSRPNRFQVEVQEGNQPPYLAYLANPGRLHELLLPGAELRLIDSPNPNSRMKRQVVGVLREGDFIPLNTHQANDITEHLLRHRLIPGLEQYEIQRREAVHGRSRFDFLLQGPAGPMYLEVKSCTLYSQKAAQFPDAVTERGKKHLDELIELADKGVSAGVLFLAPQQKTDYFLPDLNTDLAFAQSFLKAKGKVAIFPVGISFDPQSLELQPQIKEMVIPWDLLETLAQDSGDYLVILRVTRPLAIAVGTLGVQEFQPGFYVYVGSAKVALSRRLARHKKAEKKLRWHLDYLRKESEHYLSLPLLNQDGLECQLAAEIEKLAQGKISHFGDSDCRCGSHLFYFAQDPLTQANFHRMLQHYRIDRHLPSNQNQ